MSDAKLQVTVGGISFSGEGSEAWLAEQLKLILNAAPTVASSKLDTPVDESRVPATSTGNDQPVGGFTQSLASYLSAKQAAANQVNRFLATADWLRQRGVGTLSTKEVSAALADNHQSSLTNPSDCLRQNIAKGYAEKRGKTFYITPEGLRSLGHAA